MTEIINIYNQSIELVERFAQCLIKDCKNKNDTALIKELAPYINYFSNEIELTNKSNDIFDKFVSMIDSATEKPDCDDVIQQFQKEIEKVQKQLHSGKKSKKCINFMKMISEADLEDDDDDGDGNGDEIKTISQTVSTIDPISKLPIVEPVKNQKCGHTYEKSSILQLIDLNPKVKCPIPGCNATDYVKKSDLVPDNALKRMLSSTNNGSQKKLKLTE